jgi:signal transduction histidine kinase
MSTETAALYDDPRELSALLRGLPLAKLAGALRSLLGAHARLLDAAGNRVLGEGTGGACRVAINWEAEPVGWLETDEAYAPSVRALAPVLEVVLFAAARYQMTQSLHHEAAKKDYDELLRKHAELIASEARYKQLAAELDQRVKEQVRTIEQAQRSAYQSEKLAAVGSLAAGMAHEINNPIGFIKSNLATALGYVEKIAALGEALKVQAPAALRTEWERQDLDFVLTDFRSLLAESRDGAERVARIVADLKGFSGTDQVSETASDINECLQQVCNVCGPQLKGRAETVLALNPLPRTRAHPARLNQAFLNLVMNAAEAMDRPGTIRVSSEYLHGRINVRITDNGRGMSADTLARIFDPFFTTRLVGQGTGMGLTVTQDIVRAHGGTIEATSQPGQGTTFIICLPVRE